MSPKVSIIIPVYNGSNYLKEAIDSALAQDYENLEVVVVNDGSKDEGKTGAIALSYGDKIKYYPKENGGVSTALNYGLAKMTGEYFCWLSHDDLYFPDKTSAQIKFLKEHPEAKVVFGETDALLEPEHKIYTNPKYSGPEKSRGAICYFTVPMYPCSIMIHRSCFDKVGDFNTENRTTQDAEFVMKLLHHYDVYHIPKLVGLRREHAASGFHTEQATVRREFGDLFNRLLDQYNISFFFPEINPDNKKEASEGFYRLGYYLWTRARSGSAFSYFKKSFSINPTLLNPSLYFLILFNNPLKNLLMEILLRILKIKRLLTIKKRNDFLFRLSRYFHRNILFYTFRRPGSLPYLSGDTLRAFADFIFDETSTFPPDRVKAKSIIFVGSPKIADFFSNIHPKISDPYILVTHNGDNIITDEIANLLDNKIIKWYAMSAMVKNDKIVALPAGLENLHYYNNGIQALFNKFRKIKSEKKNRILYGFSISTNPAERQPAYDFLSTFQLADQISGWPTAPEYLSLLNSYKFVAAPAGNAMDSHRMWEALYLGVVPIVRRSLLMDSFKALGLPIWIIDDWIELSLLTEADLSDKYQQLTESQNNEALWFDYWSTRIKQHK